MLQWYKSLFLTEEAKSNIKPSYYRCTVRLIVLPMALLLGALTNALMGVFYFIALSQILDIVVFKILKKRESTFKDWQAFEVRQGVSLEQFDRYHNLRVTYQGVSVLIAILIAIFAFKHIEFAIFIYGPLWLISLIGAAIRAGLRFEHIPDKEHPTSNFYTFPEEDRPKGYTICGIFLTGRPGGNDIIPYTPSYDQEPKLPRRE